MLAAGCEGVAAINTITSVMGINLDTLRPEPCVEGHSTPGGYSSKAVKPIALAKVRWGVFRKGVLGGALKRGLGTPARPWGVPKLLKGGLQGHPNTWAAPPGLQLGAALLAATLLRRAVQHQVQQRLSTLSAGRR